MQLTSNRLIQAHDPYIQHKFTKFSKLAEAQNAKQRSIPIHKVNRKSLISNFLKKRGLSQN